MSNMWKQSLDVLNNVQVIIWYEKPLDLLPISDYLHPGLLPIGEPFSKSKYHNLPNLDWLIRHYHYHGVCKFKIISEEDFKGLNHYYNEFDGMDIQFINTNLLDYLIELEKATHDQVFSIIVSGYVLSNADFHQALINHQDHEYAATLFSFRGLKYQVGLVELDDFNLVTSFREKPIDKSKLVNSNMLIITNDRIGQFNIVNLQKSFVKESSLIKQLIHHIKESVELKNYELDGINGPLEVINLSSIETWIKMNPEDIIQMFTYLTDA
ncbi:MAG: hypothetical protein INQ03_18315 [Candidatus Heimdallarchaeota archaeon]|nr:hypothetical protein [Candidatus Heimdallarchaeota archaeon]